MTKPVLTQVHALPAGYTMRPTVSDDAQACVDLFNATEQHLYGTDMTTTDEVLREWDSPEIDITDATRVVLNPAGRLIGYIEVWDSRRPMYPHIWLQVHPDDDWQAIGTPMMQWALERAKQAIDRCEPDVRVAARAGYKFGFEPAETLFKTFEMQPIRHWWTMRIDFEGDVAPPAPLDGITIRPMVYPDELRQTVAASSDAFKDHWGHVETPLDEQVERTQYWLENDPKFDPTLWLVAVDDATGELAGVALNSSEARNDERIGYVNTLGVRRQWRQRGLGMALLQAAFYELQQRGKTSVTLGVDASSLTGATRLYEKAGMYVERQGTSWELELRPGREVATTELD